MRYINKVPIDAKCIHTDVVIIGSGVAGLYAALNIDPSKKVTILTKSSITSTNSDLAQGGIAAAIDENDSPKYHLKDTLTAGAGLCDEVAVKVLVDEAPMNIDRLIELGMKFDRNANGALAFTREGGHSHFRILHANGDATGHFVLKALIDRIYEAENITCIENAFLLDFLTQDDRCFGVSCVVKDECMVYTAESVCIATGGIGRIFYNTTNPYIATGDGIAAAYRAGADIKNMEFIQFHPTVFYSEHGKGFLISEALRGEGAILRTFEGHRFMKNYHTLADLAPRDIVARAIKSEMDKSNSPHVFLDITHKSKELLQQRFPTIYQKCLEQGVDISTQWIPVAPAQHYLMGGIKTDLDGQTTIKNLYASGECAWTGVHGANRLASNSLLECLVFSYRIAQTINSLPAGNSLEVLPIVDTNKGEMPISYSVSYARKVLKRAMTAHASIERNGEDLTPLKQKLDHFYDQMNGKTLRRIEEFELFNMLTLSWIIVGSALQRTESVGSHFRTDAIK
jgi:L-aspartate oxidase